MAKSGAELTKKYNDYVEILKDLNEVADKFNNIKDDDTIPGKEFREVGLKFIKIVVGCVTREYMRE